VKCQVTTDWQLATLSKAPHYWRATQTEGKHGRAFTEALDEQAQNLPL
jgi:hypothetical protein